MTMPITGMRGGERLHNDDSPQASLALRRAVGALSSPVEELSLEDPIGVDGGLATDY